MTSPVSLNTSSSATSVPESKTRDIAGAARQFEALLISQLLKSSCDAATLIGGEPGAADTTAVEMAQEHFANALAEQGGLGLARMITTTMAARAGSS
ncbi:MAG: hypothetical protein SGI92_01780 [Bryobacteraceae bacterium]|nr:hypothetical protein [Bryobacteraceae bacterium]